MSAVLGLPEAGPAPGGGEKRQRLMDVTSCTRMETVIQQEHEYLITHSDSASHNNFKSRSNPKQAQNQHGSPGRSRASPTPALQKRPLRRPHLRCFEVMRKKARHLSTAF